MFRIVFTCLLAFANPPVLPPPPTEPPKEVEPTLDDIKRDAPAEIRKYIEAAERERASLFARSKVEYRQWTELLPRLRSGTIVPQQLSQSRTFPYGHDGTIVGDGIEDAGDGVRSRFQFASREIKEASIRVCRTLAEKAERLTQLLDDPQWLVHPTIDVQKATGASDQCGQFPSSLYRIWALQVVDESNVRVMIKRAATLAGFPGPWQTVVENAWLSGVTTSGMVDDEEIDITEYEFIADGTETYTSVMGASVTVPKFSVLNVYKHVPREWFVPTKWR